MVVVRGSIWWTHMGDPQGSAPGYHRPVVIIQADNFTRSRLKSILVASISTSLRLAEAPGNVFLPTTVSGLPRDSVVNVLQIATIDKEFFEEKVTDLPTKYLYLLEQGLRMIIDL